MKLFRNRQTPGVAQQTELVSKVSALLANGARVSSTMGAQVLSTEGLSESARIELENSFETLSSGLVQLCGKLSTESRVATAAADAGAFAGLIGANPKAFMTRPIGIAAATNERSSVFADTSEDILHQRISVESYDESANKNLVANSIVYNMQATIQDPVSEAFYPIITLSPDQNGIQVQAPLYQVMRDLVRNISGKLDNYNKKNLVRAYIDPTILKNDLTKAYPVVRPESVAEGIFVDAAVIPPHNVVRGDETISTAPLKTGREVNILGSAQSDQSLVKGSFDVTDALAAGVTLKTVYVKVGADVLAIDVSNLPGNNFTYTPQGLNRQMQLLLDTTSIVLSKTTTRADGSALVDLKPIVDNDLTVRAHLALSGRLNLELGGCVIYGNAFEFSSARNATKVALAATDPLVAPIVAALATAQVIGYDLDYWLTNSNHRNRGQLIDSSYWTQIYQILPRSPITALHPVNQDGQGDASDLSTLLATTQIRLANQTIENVINFFDRLLAYNPIQDDVETPPDWLGLSRFYTRVWAERYMFDATKEVDSLKSQDRRGDVQAALVNRLTDMAHRAYVQSGYPSANQFLTKNTGGAPTLLVLTDPYTAQYLMRDGDLRTTSETFPLKIVTSVDERLAGKIYFTFTVYDEARNTRINPLSSGNLLWQPELTVVLPVSRDGQISKELTVTPSFLYINNLGIMGCIEVSKIPEVIGKLPILTVTP